MRSLSGKNHEEELILMEPPDNDDWWDGDFTHIDIPDLYSQARESAISMMGDWRKSAPHSVVIDEIDADAVESGRWAEAQDPEHIFFSEDYDEFWQKRS